MKISEMAVEYRENARLLRERISELSALLEKGKLCETENFRLRQRIATLLSMWRETSATAVFLERYYDRGCRHVGRNTF
jgi:hypothetical protein